MLTFKQFCEGWKGVRDYADKSSIKPSSYRAKKWYTKAINSQYGENPEFIKTGKVSYRSEVKDIPVDRIRSIDNQRLDAKKLKKKMKHLSSRGEFKNSVETYYHRGYYHLADGHHRVEASKKLGKSTIKANVGYI